MHVGKTGLISSHTFPLLYAAAMAVDAVAALLFGFMYDRIGVKALVFSTLLSIPFAPLVYFAGSKAVLITGELLWGIGMGTEESILKAAVATMVPKRSRATGYGVFEFSFGVFWFLGSWILGVLYDVSITAMVWLSTATQAISIPLYILSAKKG